MIFDAEAFDRRTGGDQALRAELIQMFLEDCPQRVSDMRAALERADLAALVAAAHSLKGAAAYLTASTVRGYAADIERLGLEQRLSEVSPVMAQLETAVAELLPELRNLT